MNITFRKRHVRKLHKTGGGKTYILSLPIDLVRELGWQERQKLVITKRGSKLIVQDWER